MIKFYGNKDDTNPVNLPRTPTPVKMSSSSKNSMDRYLPETEDNKGKSIDFNNLSQSELERRGLVSPHLTGITPITGNIDKTSDEVEAVSAEIDIFNLNLENNTFPDSAKLKFALYSIIKK
jgi:hypothetical protein